ncbi:MAG: ABC transporter substrate-binding protein [Candidatus Limnocylindrales bacterium]
MPGVDPRRWRLAAAALAGLFVVGACLADPANPTAEPSALPEATELAQVVEGETPLPSPTPPATPAETIRPTNDDTLVVIAPEHPTRLVPGDNLNATERLLVDVLYDPLYRLDKEMRPVPELARSLPEVKKKGDGYEWSIPIKADARFHSGEKLKASDVTFSLRMAASHSCPLGRTLCETVRTYMVDNPAKDENVVSITLSEPYAPFLTEVLAQLPILSQEDVKAATREMVRAADRLNENRPDRLITRIRESVLRDACTDQEPPDGCRLADFRQQLESVFRRADIDLPSQAPYTDATGSLDENAYLGDLLDRLAALAQVFDSASQDRNSAALGLLDATVTPFGSGPYELARIRNDGTYVLRSNPNHTRSEAKIGRMEIRVEPDPEVATTQLLNGAADWVLDVRPDQADIIDGAEGYSAASRPTDIQYGILFNVRPDRVYFDQGARRAFVQCIDHEALATALDPERPLAFTPYTVTSWANPAGQTLRARDVEAAMAALETAGWQMSEDGVRVREDGTRLSTTIAVRPTNVDLYTFANLATEQLAECGIELIVDELDLTGGDTLNQMRYPNDFDTLMWTRRLGTDPDTAVRAFESTRVTTEDNVADENPSGFVSELVDFHVAAARESMDFEVRAESYALVDEEIENLIPYWPLWYESRTSAVSARLEDRDGAIDPAESRYDWDISAWSFREPGEAEAGS